MIYPFPFTSERQKWEFMQRDFYCPSLVCFTCKMLRFLDFHRVPIVTTIFIDSTKHLLLQNTHTHEGCPALFLGSEDKLYSHRKSLG